jgi:glycosyltransferase involved in cell wall biosynthesis
MERHRIGIVIPALNEAATIGAVVRTALHHGVCLVVDDGSSDNTAALAFEAGALVVSHPENRGYDAALDSGFRRASEVGCEIILSLDADGQHDPSLIGSFIEALDKGSAVALGIRSRRARLAEHAFAWYTRMRWGIADPLCGLKAYRVEVYRALGHFDSYSSIGTELMLFAARNHYSMAQVPFEVRVREGQSRFGRRILANWKIFRALLLSFRPTPSRKAAV